MACYHAARTGERMETTDQLRYQTYLFRLWQERPAGPVRPAVWRCSLEDPSSGERHGFGSLEAAVDFLRTRMGEAVDLFGPDPGMERR